MIRNRWTAMARLIREGADVVAGSRYVVGGRQEGGPVLKRTLSRLAGMSLHYLAGLPIHDATNNFRAYSRRVIEQIPIEGEASFAIALELTSQGPLARLAAGGGADACGAIARRDNRVSACGPGCRIICAGISAAGPCLVRHLICL